jgi:hypothetical protein
MMLTTRKDRKKRGQVLLLTAFFIFVLFTLALAFFKLVPMELNSALRTRQTVSAQLVADSGIREARVWLQRQDPSRSLTNLVLEDEFNRTTRELPVPMGNTWDAEASPEDVVGDWSYGVTLARNPTNPFAFDAVSTCYFDGEPMRQSRATLARENFSRYALFIDRWGDDLFMTASPGAIQGPFHTNDFFKLFVPSDFYGTAPDSFVTGSDGVMTHAGSTSEGGLDFVPETGDGNAYYDSSGTANSNEATVPYDEDGEINDRYDTLVRGGRSNLNSSEHIVMPYDADELMSQALGVTDLSTATFFSEVGIHVPHDSSGVTGGIFLIGSAKVKLSLDSSGNQVHTFTQDIPEDAFAYETEEDYYVDIWGDVDRHIPEGGTYNVKVTSSEQVDVRRQTGSETRTTTVTERVPTGRRLSSGGGGGTSVGGFETTYRNVSRTVERSVPVYDTVQETRQVTRTESRTVTNPDGMDVTEWRVVDREQHTRIVTHVVSEDDYESNPGAYPGAWPIELPPVPQTATVTEIDGANPKTVLVDYEGETHEYDGALNGVTFVDGNVTALEGVSKGARDMNFPDEEIYQGRYIVANPGFASAGKMTITDDLLQFYDGDDPGLRGDTPKTLKIGELSPSSEHSLGLVSKETRMRPSRNNILNMYAIILAGRSLPGTATEDSPPDVEGGFGSDNSIMNGGYGFNTFNLFGGLVQANQMRWHQNGGGMSGKLTYDPAVARDLPRFPRSNRVTTLRYADRYMASAAALDD